ncbi:MAG: glycoside hydrolase family 28 protein [Prevotellaceae bacterium]|nr:glycoside hydrolase family 28 protein [Prevotellaceae bacterium]
MLFLSTVCTANAKTEGNIVHKNEVGASVMPEEIAPIKDTPFEMESLARPIFPDRKETITSADVDGNGMITKAVNEKIAKLSKRGGGTMVVPSGHWKSGRITLKSNVNLHLEKGAILEFSESIADYQPPVFTRHEGVEVMGAGAFIYANKAKNIGLTGEGTIMGPSMDVEMRKLPNGNSVVEKDIDYKMSVKKRICDGLEGRTFYRPKSFSPINCKNVLVEGVSFERSVLWNVNPVYCENVIIRGITVNSTDVPSGDGIDISSCKNVLIEYSTLNCGDDCFTLKAGRCEDGLRVNKPTENVVIRYCLAKDGHGGITCGSETAGGIKNVYLHDCVFYGTRTGFRFKTRRNRGGTVEGITYDRIRLVDVREAFTWDLLGSKTYMGELARRNPPLEITPLTPTVKDITIKNFIVESADRLMTVNAIPEIPCSNVLIENGIVRTNRIIRTINDADGFKFKNLEINATDNNIVVDDSRNIVFENVTLNVPNGKLNVEVKGNKGEDIIYN